jgi:hypothetical protein
MMGQGNKESDREEIENDPAYFFLKKKGQRKEKTGGLSF